VAGDSAGEGLELHQVTKAFGGEAAVGAFSLSVSRGETVALFGPNGAGKTTLLRMAAGILRADSGKLRVGGADLVSNPREAKRKIGWVADHPLLYDELTIAENVAYFGRLYGLSRDEAASRAERLLKEFGVLHRSADLAASLSLGMRQRASIARALVHDPAVLLLDEPFEGLDPRGQEALLQALRGGGQGQGRAVLFATQQIDLGLRACDRLVLMDRGKLVRTAAPSSVTLESLTRELRGLGGDLRAE
jgi:ABC-2 type transport system ATP-binding protein